MRCDALGWNSSSSLLLFIPHCEPKGRTVELQSHCDALRCCCAGGFIKKRTSSWQIGEDSTTARPHMFLARHFCFAPFLAPIYDKMGPKNKRNWSLAKSVRFPHVSLTLSAATLEFFLYPSTHGRVRLLPHLLPSLALLWLP